MVGFPRVPDWDKVQKATLEIGEMLEKLELNFTEKYNTLMLAQSIVQRDFIGANVVSWLDDQYKKEVKELKSRTTPGIT